MIYNKNVYEFSALVLDLAFKKIMLAKIMLAEGKLIFKKKLQITLADYYYITTILSERISTTLLLNINGSPMPW